ncbi:MAG TPA: DNA-directed RNA polymerase subunit omega [Clostridiales bacterium]|nr:DNA-directed RNA polymerase subunit omega [Clostridiales bacterium]
MINNPPIDDLAEKMGSKYALCVIASKRARQIIDHAQNQGYTDLPSKKKPLTEAAEEIYEGKVTISKY